MTDTEEHHYQTLSPDKQLIWRLQARRNINDEEPILYQTGEPQSAWHRRMYSLNDMGKHVDLALDVMTLALLDLPPELPDGLRRTAWKILQTDADVFTSLGHDDATRLEALARPDTGPLINRDIFEKIVVFTCIHQEEQITAVLITPRTAQELVVHTAASSLACLKSAVQSGLALEGASPELQAAITRILAANIHWEPGHHLEMPEPARSLRQVLDELQRDVAIQCVVLIIRLLYLPQFLPAKVDMKQSLENCALIWRIAHDLWKGEREWQADLDLIRTHLRTLGRANDHFRKMRSMERYGPAVPVNQILNFIQQGKNVHEDMIVFTHIDAPDIDPAVLTTLGTPAGRLAGRLAHVVMNSVVPRVRWGVHMQALDVRVQNVPPPD